jgi:DNA-binding beta-propeller fold protein YncE
LLLVALPWGGASPAQAQVESTQRLVRTLAGNGLPGNRDGRAGEAEFLFPTGITYDRTDGSIYVADSAGQRIRRVSRDGIVTTVAGSGDISATGTEVPGGYRDGEATQARFNYPFAIAIAADHSLYVADSRNHCIRRIADGRVTTFAGSPQTPGNQNGALHEATFTEPRGLGFDADGTLYVADYGVGVRRISAQGVVSNLALPREFAKGASSISVWTTGEQSVYVAGASGVLRYNVPNHVVDGFSPLAYEQHVSPFGVVAISTLMAVVSSPRYNGIYLHDGKGPDWEPIAGEAKSDPAESGGFSDGAPSTAKFYAPLGLAADAEGNVLVADAGNRRVRFVPRVDPTMPEGLSGDRDPKIYRIAYVSNSFAFKNTFWENSIEARIARRLNAGAHALGLSKKVVVDGITFPDAPLKPDAQYIEEVLGNGNVDLVVFSLNSFFFRDTNESAPYFREPAFTSENIAEWKSIFAHLKTVLASTGTQLVIADQPFGFQVGPTEDVELKDDISLALQKTALQTVRQSGFGYATNLRMEALLDSVGIPHLSTYRTFLNEEQRAHRPVYLSTDFHFNTAGNALYANLVSDFLEKLKPWQNAKGGR